MAGKQAKSVDWGALRRLYEDDAYLSYAQIADSVGVTRQAVRQRATREGWQKRLDPGVVHERVSSVGDANFTENAAEQGNQAVTVYESNPGDPDQGGDQPRAIDAAAVSEAARRRQELLERQRKEWDYARSLVYDAIKEKGKRSALEKSRYAKTVAEALKVVQEGERRAWGIVDEGGSGKPPAAPASIVVHMQQGVKIGG